MRIIILVTLFFLWAVCPILAQTEKRWIKHQVKTLSGPAMHGRGYVDKGGAKAAQYLSRKFREFGLLPFTSDSSYYQPFTLPVNTFPGEVYLKLQRKEMKPGADYIVHAASPSYHNKKIKVSTIDLNEVRDSIAWSEVRADIKAGKAYVLKNTDTTVKYLKLTRRRLERQLPAGLFIIPRHGKITWTVAGDTIPATVFYVEDTVMPKRIRKIAAKLDAEFIPSFKSNNVLGFVPGTEKPDSFILFTAHFDHLGKMGRNTMFPGANDNASGTSLMLYMASYFARNPQKYTMVFIGFSGEEAGLVGSQYFTEHPIFPLRNIRLVVNMDMTGDAKDGITVVNAIEQKDAFSLLRTINEEQAFLPEIRERDQTQNSDHYYFSKKGVPAIFIYGNSTRSFYHDIFDTSSTLSLENVDKLARLLIEFVTRL